MSNEELYLMHKTIKKVGEDLLNIKFNTAIAAMMEWLNFLSAKESVSMEEYKTLLLLLAPFAPHITEELWQELRSEWNDAEPDLPNQTEPGFSAVPRQVQRSSAFESIHEQAWPEYKEEFLKTESVTIAIQVNGKLRGSLEVESSEAESQLEVEAKAKQIENISKHLAGKTITNVIYIQGKILNFVTR